MKKIILLGPCYTPWQYEFTEEEEFFINNYYLNRENEKLINILENSSALQCNFDCLEIPDDSDYIIVTCTNDNYASQEDLLIYVQDNEFYHSNFNFKNNTLEIIKAIIPPEKVGKTVFYYSDSSIILDSEAIQKFKEMEDDDCTNTPTLIFLNDDFMKWMEETGKIKQFKKMDTHDFCFNVHLNYVENMILKIENNKIKVINNPANLKVENGNIYSIEEKK